MMLISIHHETLIHRHRLPAGLGNGSRSKPSRGQPHWQSLLEALPPLITTSYVFDETVTFFNSRGYHAKAVEVGNNLLYSPSVQLIPVDEALFHEGWKLLKQYQDKRYSLTDCISFATMRKLSIDTALAFDRHFIQAGFQMLPCHSV